MEENIPKCSYFCISVGVQVIIIEITLEWEHIYRILLILMQLLDLYNGA